MKTLFSLSAICVMIATFSSCDKTKIPSVINTNITVADSEWSYTVNGEWVKTLLEPTVTQGVVQAGTVMVFEQDPVSLDYYALPYTGFVGGVALSFYYSVSVGTVKLYISAQNPVSISLKTLVFRVVAISPAQRQAHSNTDWTNYKECIAAISSE